MNESIPTAVLSTCSHQAVTYLLVQILTVILNFVAFIVLSQIKGYKGNTNHFVVRILVLSDAVGAVTTATPISMSCLGYTLHNSNVCQAFGFLSNVILLWTVLIVLLMCILRYLAVVRPLFYRTYVTFTAVKWLLVGLLIWSSAHIVLPLFGVGRFKYFPIGQYCSFEIPPERKRDFALVHLIVWEGWLFIVILIYLTVSMVRELSVKRKHASRLSFQQRRGIHANRIRQRGYTRMTVVIVTIFLVCYIPFLVYRTLTLVRKHVDGSFHFHLHLLAHINPMLNPILYVSCNRGYKTAVRSMFGKAFTCFAEPVRRVSTSNSICMSLFSEDGITPRQNLARNSTTSFLEVPSVRNRESSTSFAAEKPVKRRRGKRNSIDVSNMGSPTRDLKAFKGDLVSPGRSELRIDEQSEAQGHQSTNYIICQTSPSAMSPCHAGPSHPLELELARKPRGLSVSSILYAVDNFIVQRGVSPVPPVVIASCIDPKNTEDVNGSVGSSDDVFDD